MEVVTEFFNSVVKWVNEAVQSYVINPFLNITVRDVVDIVLLTLLFFTIYRFTRKRRAGRLLLGLFLVILVGFLVNLFKLPTLTLIVHLFAEASIFCLVVVFQPEFRDLLERIGNGKLLNPGSDTLPRRKIPAAREMVGEVSDAVYKMAESRTGALIVFEGLTKLGDYISTGKIVDAKTVSPLLCNIFFENAPLHDGAVIIRNMRIYAARCVLPSTRSKTDFGGLGTRHRAAVGVTEVSDAFVVVVSEQSGTVSVAQNGELLRGVVKDQLEDLLMAYVAGRAYHNYKRKHLRESYRNMLEKVARRNDEAHKAPSETPVVELLEDAPEDAKGGKKS